MVGVIDTVGVTDIVGVTLTVGVGVTEHGSVVWQSSQSPRVIELINGFPGRLVPKKLPLT